MYFKCLQRYGYQVNLQLPVFNLQLPHGWGFRSDDSCPMKHPCLLPTLPCAFLGKSINRSVAEKVQGRKQPGRELHSVLTAGQSRVEDDWSEWAFAEDRRHGRQANCGSTCVRAGEEGGQWRRAAWGFSSLWDLFPWQKLVVEHGRHPLRKVCNSDLGPAILLPCETRWG